MGRRVGLWQAGRRPQETPLVSLRPARPPCSRRTAGLFVEQGTLLGYMGDYNGDSPRTVWTHLHFSIVRDDGSGNYTNEPEFGNTLDPSSYLGTEVNYERAGDVAGCAVVRSCSRSKEHD